MNDFDRVIESLGGFGPYQRQVFILCNLMDTPAAWAMLLPIFIGAAPDWWCQLSHDGTFITHLYHMTYCASKCKNCVKSSFINMLCYECLPIFHWANQFDSKIKIDLLNNTECTICI